MDLSDKCELLCFPAPHFIICDKVTLPAEQIIHNSLTDIFEAVGGFNPLITYAADSFFDGKSCDSLAH